MFYLQRFALILHGPMIPYGVPKKGNERFLDSNRRRLKLFQVPLDPNLKGMEIGPLDRPLVKKSECQVIYVDHLHTSDLLKKYQHDNGVNQKEIVEVDFVWKGSYSEILSETAKLDFVVASHVIEHVPDLIYFLQDLSQVMKVGGLVYLVVPDKRFTFDFLREKSTISEILAVSLLKPQKPNLIQIMNELVLASDHSIHDGWNKTDIGYTPNPSRTLFEAFEIAKKLNLDKNYFDVHCWIFTPESFVEIVKQLNDLNLIDFKVNNIIETAHMEFEFYCVIEKFK